MVAALSRIGAFGAMGLLLSATPAPAGPPSAVEYESEKPDDPPAAAIARADLAARSPGLRVPFGPYQSIQVNVDTLGRNIVGDAANEPSIAVNPTNPLNMVIGWRQFDSISSNFRQAGWGYTFNGGQSWTFPGSIRPGNFQSDPSLDADAQGTFYYQSLTFDLRVLVFRSTNGGVTWPDTTFEYGGDKNWLAVDRTGGASNGYVYGIWQRFGSPGYGSNVFTRSTDGGATFEFPVPVETFPVFGDMAIGPDGEVYATGVDGSVNQDRNHFVVANSTNARNPAATPTFTGRRAGLGGSMPFFSPTEPNPEGLKGQANVAVNWAPGPSRGEVYLAASVAPIGGNRPSDARLSRSTDGGTSFGPSVRVNDDASSANWHWLEAHAVSPGGRIDMVWYDTRNTGQPNLSQLFYAYSWDGGVSWSANVPVTPVFDTSVGYPNQQKIGDYSTVVSNDTGADVAFAATFNNEQDIYYVRVFPDCNTNGVSDVTDVANAVSVDCDANHVPDECQTASACGLAYVSNTVVDACMAGGSGGGSVDPGEDAGLTVVLRNNGSQAMTHVAATLLTSTPGVTISQAATTFPDVPAHGTSSGHFAFTVGTAVPCGSPIDLSLAATSDQGSWTRPFSLSVGTPQTATQSQSATDVPKPIADFATTTSSMTFASNASVLDVNVNLSLLHKDDGELALTLVAPNGARILLSNGEGAGGENYTNATFDDEGTAVIWTGSAPFSDGPYRPEQPLSVVDGIPAAGTWALEISDVKATNSGKLLSWSMTPTLAAGFACSDCAVSAPELSPDQLTWSGDKSTLSWGPVAGASFYGVYRGTPPDLPALLTPAADSCRLAVTSSTTSAGLAEIPPEGSFYWYVVRSANGAGEGPAGDATAPARSLNSSGACP